jgi:hypothetical protein
MPELFSDIAPKWDSLYLSNCTAKESSPFLFALYISSRRIISKHGNEGTRGVQFTFIVKGDTKKIVFDRSQHRFPSKPGPRDLVHGLILYLEQDNLPLDLSLDNVSFILFLSAKKCFPFQQLHVRSEPSLDPIEGRPLPNLKRLFLKDVFVREVRERFASVLKLRLDIHTLQNIAHPGADDRF